MRRSLQRLVGRLVWPPTRLMLVGVLWWQRDTVAMWARSLATEVRSGKTDGDRLRLLVRSLWDATQDGATSEGASIRSIRVESAGGDVDGADVTTSVIQVELTEVAAVDDDLVDYPSSIPA